MGNEKRHQLQSLRFQRYAEFVYQIMSKSCSSAFYGVIILFGSTSMYKQSMIGKDVKLDASKVRLKLLQTINDGQYLLIIYRVVLLYREKYS